MKVNELIANRRKELGLTLEEVAEKVGVSKSTVKKWESGYIKNMRRDNMALLADALHISPLDLLGPDEDPKPADDNRGYYVDPEVAATTWIRKSRPSRKSCGRTLTAASSSTRQRT